MTHPAPPAPDIETLIRQYRDALAADPGNVVGLNNLASLLQLAGRPEEASLHLRRALALAPGIPELLLNAGDAARGLRQVARAATVYRRTLAARPGFPEAQNNLGLCLRTLGDADGARDCFTAVVRARPDNAEALNNLGNALHLDRRLAEASVRYRQALALRPDMAAAHMNRGNEQMDLGDPATAATVLRRSLALAQDAAVRTNLIFALDFLPGLGVAEQQAERRRWNDIHGWIGPILPHANSRDPLRRLKLGFVSADFREHSAASIFGPIMRRLDRRGFEVVAYSSTIREDWKTDEFRSFVDLWRPVVGLAPDKVAELVRADGIDIVIDLSGHSGGNQLLALARKPAPVLVNGWGHPTGTGIPAMDYLISDPVLIPHEVRALFVEEICDMPCYITFEAPADAPPVGDRRTDTPIVFGCFNRASKIGPDVVDAWSRILSAVPDARLVIKDTALDDARARRRLVDLFAARGVDASRVELRGRTPRADHLAQLTGIDIALDPFPQNGGISTMEALYMGVPVVAFLGTTPASRASAPLLRAAGLPEWIASDVDAYVRLAIDRARGRDALSALRGSLRQRLARTEMGNPDLYVLATEKAFRTMWTRWCEGRTARPTPRG